MPLPIKARRSRAAFTPLWNKGIGRKAAWLRFIQAGRGEAKPLCQLGLLFKDDEKSVK